MDDYTRGALTAVALFVRLRGSHTTAAETLIGLGLSHADCSGLDDYCKGYLAKLDYETRLGLTGLAPNAQDQTGLYRSAAEVKTSAASPC